MLWSESFSIVASKLGPNSEPFSVNLNNILVFAKCKYYLSLHTSWLAYSTYLYLDTGKSVTCSQNCWTPILDYLWSCEGMALFTSHTYSRSSFYRTRVRSMFTLVTHSLTDSLTHWLTDSCLVNLMALCDLWRCQLKTCWGCYCCWCWWLETFWRQFYADLEAEVWS